MSRLQATTVTFRLKTNSNDFKWVLELFSRFEFAFCFLKDSNFWCVQSSTTCNETAHVHVLWPVCTYTIPFRMFTTTNNTTTTTTTTHTQHNTTSHTTSYGDRDRETEKDRGDRERKKREDGRG